MIPDNNWRAAQIYFEQWQQAKAELQRLADMEDVTVRDGGRDGDLYRLSLYWIVKERAGAGGWPPLDVGRVSGWTVVRMVAAVFDRNVGDVARDVIKIATQQKKDR